MRLKIFILLVSAIFLSEHPLSAQDDPKTSICRVYGKVQGIYFDAFTKACSTTSSDAACKDLMDELEKSFSIAVASREDYVAVNTVACDITLKKLQDGIMFTLETSSTAKAAMKDLFSKLKKIPGVTSLSSNLN